MAMGFAKGSTHPYELHRSSLSGRLVPQRGSIPAEGKAFDLPAHDFQALDFQGAARAARKVPLAGERIRRVQLSVEKSVKGESPFRAGRSPNSAAFGRRRLHHSHVYEVAERKRHLAPLADAGLAERLLRFDQLHLKPPALKQQKPFHAKPLLRHNLAPHERLTRL